MFCQVKTLTTCKDIATIQKSLYLSDKCDENWLSDCQVCLSPCNSLLVFAKQQRMTILTTQWDSTLNTSVFVDSWIGTLPYSVTALLVLQISTGDSREGNSDWLCIIVGFSTGEVGFYTDQGQLLILEKLDDSPVLQLKCHTGQHSSDTDEVYVIFSESICCLAATSLLQTLRYARVQLAKARAGASKDINLEGQNLQMRKLGFVDQDVVCDASVIGLELSNTFDHLLTASTHGGFFVGYRSFAPHNTVVVGVGARPYVGFHQALEGGSVQPLINDVARAVASKIKSALPGWLGGGKTQTQNVPQVPQSSDKMHCRFSLCDLRRRGLSAVVSPDRRLLSVADSLGRVLLIDVKRGVAVRMFKGYRNCQCGFLQVNEESSKRRGTGQKALFLVLYVGKRGLLEIWPLRGPRIAAFSAAQNARLLYYTHNMLQQGPRKSSSSMNSPTIMLLDPDGQIKQFVVPFHFALNSENSNRARDVHIVKRLRQIIKDKDYDNAELKNEVLCIVKELNTTEMKIHCVEMMAANKNVTPDILLVCIVVFYETRNEETIPPDVIKLNTLCENLFSLIMFYMFTNGIEISDSEDYFNSNLFVLKDVSVDEENVDDSDTKIEIFGKAEYSIITESELQNLQHLLNLAISTEMKRSQHAKVTFKEEKKSICSEFLSSFDLKSVSDMLILKESISNELLLFISHQIFDSYILGKLDWCDVKSKYLKVKHISPLVLRKLLLIYWMNLPLQDIIQQRMERFGNTLYEICKSVGFENVYAGYNETSPWWKSVRDYLIDSSCPFRSMVSAQLCRAVALKIEKEEENKQSDLDDLWESVSKDNAQWGLLIGKLDDISLLSILLSQKPETFNALPNLPIELPEINLKFVYNKGKGSISELTAMWLCIAGVDPNDIADSGNKNEVETACEDNKKSNLLSIQFQFQEKNNVKQINMSIFDKLSLLRKQFPFSLTSSNLVTNMCWEYTLFWSKNIDELKYLDAALSCIKCIDNLTLRSGICAMIWSAHLVHPFESACKLISKVGKLPREKLCKQNVGLTDVQLLKFLKLATEFLDLLLCSSLSAKDTETAVVRFEDMWEGNSTALTELALANSKVNIDILQVHYQLSAAIYYQCFLGSNFWKHLSNLFDIESQKCIFGLLNKCSDVTFHQSTDSRVTLQRTNFLSRLVQKCVELAKDRELWIEHLQDLARLWRVNDDHVRGEHVVYLYAQGLDAEAEEALLSVTNLKPLIEVLTPMAGRRLKHFVDNTDDRSNVISILPTQVTSYLKALEDVPNETVAVKSLDETHRLIEIIITHCEQRTEKHSHKIASMLLDACTILQSS
ncbi:rab3 GTPase activating protein [Arctopsyche grandis]|uniref:rab3 GTPase activating protein n=1 Tax=Arctopsyche grandis TaxID=121162 RepID=UPI00406D7956